MCSLEPSQGFSGSTLTSKVDGCGADNTQAMVPSDSRELFGSARGSPLNENGSGLLDEECSSTGNGLGSFSKAHSLKFLPSMDAPVSSFHSPSGACGWVVWDEDLTFFFLKLLIGVPLYTVPSSACILPGMVSVWVWVCGVLVHGEGAGSCVEDLMLKMTRFMAAVRERQKSASVLEIRGYVFVVQFGLEVLLPLGVAGGPCYHSSHLWTTLRKKKNSPLNQVKPSRGLGV